MLMTLAMLQLRNGERNSTFALYLMVCLARGQALGFSLMSKIFFSCNINKLFLVLFNKNLIKRNSQMKPSLILVALSVASTLSGCITFANDGSRDIMPLGQKSFNQYVRETTDWIQDHRRFVTGNHQLELSHQVPFEIKPRKPNGKGILMIHGFTDSPYNFVDIAHSLAEKGFLVRTVVLPGHCTKPEDMLSVTIDDWDRLIDEQTRLLAQDVSHVYLAGFSTGANLAVHEAYENRSVDGLILFSPALSVRTNLVYLVPFLSHFIDWIKSPDEVNGGMTPFRYRVAPLQALNTFKLSMDSAKGRLIDSPYEKPVIVFMAENDSIVNTQELLPLMQRQFNNAKSHFVWYGDTLPQGTIASDKRLTVLTDHLPKYKIRSFSHLGIVYSPDNPYYGINGSERFCLKDQDEQLIQYCHENRYVWYGSWNENRDGHPYARLTFNPYFNSQIDLIVSNLN